MSSRSADRELFDLVERRSINSTRPIVERNILPRLSRKMLELSFLDLSLPLSDCCVFSSPLDDVLLDDVSDVGEAAAAAENDLPRLLAGNAKLYASDGLTSWIGATEALPNRCML